MSQDSMIRRLLIANRGEIARRIQRTAAGMGIHTVAIYAEDDAGAPFVREADEAFALGGTTAAESYLDVAKVLDAARRSGADAVHPGYGFLSENAAFASAVLEAGLVWVGPPPGVIDAMGDKLAAKRVMADAGVPMLPSVEIDESTDLAAAAREVGFPALVKAAAGGGGKGMRVVTRAEDLGNAVAAARREAAAAFGNPTVFLERYVTGARHVEIQILGDRFGNLVHCFERECSIQRRHQKVIEESPSSAVDGALRSRMGEAAISGARAMGYQNAGTVEFLLGPGGEFYFLEVNTRLQVEHPVTEAVTGLDLVREQIRVAEGEPLSFGQSDLSMAGHAVEARLYAEDPERDFLPATGTLLAWAPPVEPAVRFDSGVETGSHVGVQFDPMLAKVIAHAPTRSEAAKRLALALERTRIQGVVTNRDFLVSTLRHPEFLAGNTTTGFIDDVEPERRRSPKPGELRSAAIAAALFEQEQNRRSTTLLRTIPSGWRNSVMPPERIRFRHGGDEVLVEYRHRRDGSFEVATAGETGAARVRGLDGDLFDLEIDGRCQRMTVHSSGAKVWVHGATGDLELERIPRFPAPEVGAVAGGLVAPMPGKVLAAEVEVGDSVERGQLLLILEAMKMEHRIVAPHAGLVVECQAKVGEQVGNGDLLIVVEEKD